jgi:hypothetical protein
MKSTLVEMIYWAVLAPLYAAMTVFLPLLIMLIPPMLDLPFQHSGLMIVKDLLRIAYIWIGIAALGGGYAFLTAVIPSTLTGVTRIAIKTLGVRERLVDRSTYIAAFGFSMFAAVYFLRFMGWSVGLDSLLPLLGLSVVFCSIAAMCCSLILSRRLAARSH